MEITAVASAKGGVGKSSFCVGVGKMLAERSQKTLLVDMDIGVRSLDLLLGVAEKTVYDWGDALCGNCGREKAVLEVNRNLALLPAPQNEETSFSPSDFQAMINAFRKEYPFILLDAPAGFGEGFQLAAACAKSCILVTMPDPVSLRAASAAAVRVRKTGIRDVRLVVNRYSKKSGIPIDPMIDTVSAQLLGVVPDSPEIARTFYGKDLPFDSRGNQSYFRIAGRLCGESIPIREKYL